MGKGKVFDKYDYESFYNKSLVNDATGELLEDVYRQTRGVAYTTVTYKSGNQLEVEVFPSFKKMIPDMIQRFKRKRKVTSDTQRNLNDRHSKKKFFRLLHENFNVGDYFITLTFNEEPKSEEEAEKLIHNFFRRINRARKNKGLDNAKYLYVLEQEKRLHFHVIMDKGLSMEEVDKRWKKQGMISIKCLRYYRDENFLGLSNYLMKEKTVESREKGKRRWGSSKGNLIHPKGSYNRTKLSKRKVYDMVLNQHSLGDKLEGEYQGYQFKHYEIYHNDVNGLFYIYARLECKRLKVMGICP